MQQSRCTDKFKNSNESNSKLYFNCLTKTFKFQIRKTFILIFSKTPLRVKTLKCRLTRVFEIHLNYNIGGRDLDAALSKDMETGD